MDAPYTWHATVRKLARVSGSSADKDRRVVARVAAGEERALGELYARFGGEVFRYLLALTNDRRLAEEALQDTFLAVWRGAGIYEGRSGVRTWLFGVARRRARDASRRRLLELAGEGELESLVTEELGPEESLLTDARRQELADVVGRLAPAHREALALVFVHGLSYAEAAEVLDVPLGTVKSRLSNARRTLKAILEDSEYGG